MFSPSHQPGRVTPLENYEAILAKLCVSANVSQTTTLEKLFETLQQKTSWLTPGENALEPRAVNLGATFELLDKAFNRDRPIILVVPNSILSRIESCWQLPGSNWIKILGDDQPAPLNRDLILLQENGNHIVMIDHDNCIGLISCQKDLEL